VWSADGRLFYRGQQYLMVATLVTRPTLDVARTDTVFRDPYARITFLSNYDLLPDGSGFLFVRDRLTDSGQTLLFGIVNWTSTLK